MSAGLGSVNREGQEMQGDQGLSVIWGKFWVIVGGSQIWGSCDGKRRRRHQFFGDEVALPVVFLAVDTTDGLVVHGSDHTLDTLPATVGATFEGSLSCFEV